MRAKSTDVVPLPVERLTRPSIDAYLAEWRRCKKAGVPPDYLTLYYMDAIASNAKTLGVQVPAGYAGQRQQQQAQVQQGAAGTAAQL